MISLLLIFIAMASVGCQQPDEVKVVQTKPQTNSDCRFRNLSETFRETAGDTFDHLQSLETNELEGKIFYQLAEQEADRAVLKTQRIASNPDEKKLAEYIDQYFQSTRLYRETTMLVNETKDLEARAAAHPDIYRQVYREHPELKHRENSADYIKLLSNTEEQQRLNKTVIAACVMRSYKKPH